MLEFVFDWAEEEEENQNLSAAAAAMRKKLSGVEIWLFPFRISFSFSAGVRIWDRDAIFESQKNMFQKNFIQFLPFMV